MEEEFLKDLGHNNQRLDEIIASIRTLMKPDPRTKRGSVSPLSRPAAKRGV